MRMHYVYDHEYDLTNDLFGLLTIDQALLFRNTDVFEITDNLKKADIVVCKLFRSTQGDEFANLETCLKRFDHTKVCVITDFLFHVEENYITDKHLDRLHRYLVENRPPFRKFIIPHTDASNRELPEWFVYTDFLFNRSYSAHHDTFLHSIWKKDFTKNHWWSDSNEWDFELWKLPNDSALSDDSLYKKVKESLNQQPKFFVCPSNTSYSTDEYKPGPNRGDYRVELIELLKDYHGYIGNRFKSTPLMANKSSVSTDDILGVDGWGFAPPHNAYYNSTAISFFVETLIYGDVMCATEKTWTPILKGHFVLPFANHGFINHLKQEYDMRFPEWIDYSYDNETDLDTRWNAYKEEVIRLCELGGDKLMSLKFESKQILIHNRNQIRYIGYKNDFSNHFVKNTDK